MATRARASEAPLPASLAARLAALHAERVRTWASDALQRNIDQRAELVAAARQARWPAVGDRLPRPVGQDHDLRGLDGQLIDLGAAAGPLVLLFFRFATCPACNIALPYYQEALWPALQAHGVPLVAASPQVPERLGVIAEAHDLGFTLASDTDNRLARALGITFEANAATRAATPAGQLWLGEVTGTGSWELPQPAALIITPGRRIAFIDVSPDWMVRTEAETILAALQRLHLP
jgi:peroxiredoxin